MFKKDNKIIEGYFFILFSLIPVSIILGPAISLFNIILINFAFICLIIHTKEYKFLSDKTVKLALILWLYLIFNSIMSENFSIGALRNFGFIRFIILFCAFNYFFYYKSFFNKILIIWFLTLFIITLDTYIESFIGKNILGYGEAYGSRIVSFFKDEPIVGGYINAFYLIIAGYLFSLIHKFPKNYKYIILILSFSFLVAIFLTGERSSAIKATFGFLIFYQINNHFKIKEKLISISLILILIFSLVNYSDYLKFRYKLTFLDPIATAYHSYNEKSLEKKTPNSLYFKLYQSGFSVFKNYPFFGVGNKNYRLETCAKIIKQKYICNTHPHQIYFEFLAEHGLIGTIIILYILFNLIFGKLKIILQSKNYVQIGSFIFLFNLFIPLLPSGAFFTDYSLTVFWLVLSIMYSVNKKTNIFSKN
jgi:O-antigen ligase